MKKMSLFVGISKKILYSIYTILINEEWGTLQ